MTKTLTEQWREGTLPEGYYYVLYADQGDHYPSCDTEDYDDVDYWNGCEWHYEDDPVIKVLAAVPSYDKLQTKDILLDSYKKENKRLNAVLKHIEKLAGEYVDELVDVKRKAEQLEKSLAIATKALKDYANCKPTEWMSCVTADKALKEMEGVK